MGKQADKKLTDQENIFVEEYLVKLCPHKAALEAKYSKTVATSKAFQWVSDSKLNPKPHVRAAIQKALDARSKRTEITQDMVLQELAKLAFSNMSDYATWSDRGVKLKDSEELTFDQAACVVELSESPTGGIKFKLHDKKSALVDVGKHLGMFNDKQLPKDDTQNSVKIDTLIADAEKRAGGDGKVCH